VVKFGPQDGDVEIRDLPKPVLLAGTVRVRIVSVGVCGSDLHMWRNTQSWPIRLPVTLGHEAAGVVESGGAGVDGWRVGDRVV
jgi:L-iditol 2-dehydrogenase